MPADRYARARDLFLAALERPPEERSAFLREACGDDAALLAEVETLLEYHDEGPDLMDAPTPARPRKPAPPRQVGPYHLLQKLGEGGMGEVYEAEQEVPVKRRVAIKLVKWGMSSDEISATLEKAGAVDGDDAAVRAAKLHSAVSKAFPTKTLTPAKGLTMFLV